MRTPPQPRRRPSTAQLAPAVSVIVPAFGVAHLLGEALASLAAQSFPHWEAIVVDDGTPDDVVAAFAPFAGDARFRLLRTDNGGVSVARNRAVAVANAPVVCFLDGDDSYEPDYLARMLPRLAADPALGFVSCDARVCYPGRRPSTLYSERYPMDSAVSLEAVLTGRVNIFTAALVRRTAFEQVGGFDPELAAGEDLDLWIRLLAAGWRGAILPQPLVRYRRRPGSLSASEARLLTSSVQLYGKAAAALSGRPEAAAARRLEARTRQALRWLEGETRILAGDVVGGLQLLQDRTAQSLRWGLGLGLMRAAPALAAPVLRTRAWLPRPAGGRGMRSGANASMSHSRRADAPGSRLQNIQALRALAALLVVFVHLGPLAELAGWGPRAMAFGHAGVDVFFVISGLVMVTAISGRRTSPGAFLRDRLARIAPLYWTITLLVFALALAAPGLMRTTRADPTHLLKSLAFLPYVRADGLLQPIVFVGWTLNYEMAFYLVFALGLTLRRRWLGLGLVVVALGGVGAFGWLLRPADPLVGFYTSPLVLEFAAGMVVGAISQRLRVAPSVGAGAAATVIGLAALALMLAGPRLWPQVARPLMFGAPATLIVVCALVAERAGVVIRHRGLQALGAASYAIYLTHFFCTEVVVRLAERLAAPGWLAPLAAAAFILVILVGVGIHRIVELPLTQWARTGLRFHGAPVMAIRPRPPAPSA